RSLGKTANLAGGVVRPHRNGLAHGKPPQFAILNHAAIDSGIPRESATQRLGITHKLPSYVSFRANRTLSRHRQIQMVFGSIHATCPLPLVADRAMEAWYHPSIA